MRGLRSKGSRVLNDGKVTMYHVTPVSNLPGILSRGLLVGSHKTFPKTGSWTESYIFLEDNKPGAKEWALLEGSDVENWALLSVRLRENNIEFTGGGWATKRSISSRDIELVEKFSVLGHYRDTSKVVGRKYRRLSGDG